MLIKVKSNVFINSDNILYVALEDDSAPAHILVGNTHVDVSNAAALFVLELLEANSAFVPSGELASAPQATLKSKLAQTLRDTWQGPTLGFLQHVIDGHGEAEVMLALDELIEENVVVIIPEGEIVHYYHASSATAQDYLRQQREQRAICANCHRQRWYHVSIDIHCPNGFTSSPDPSDAGAALRDSIEIPAGHSEQTVDPKIDD